MENKTLNIIKYTFLMIGIALLALAFYLKGDALLVLMILGSVFFAIGAGMMAFEWMRNKKEQELRTTGQLIQAELQTVRINEAIEVNGKSPFQIVAQWHHKNSNQLYEYTSANLWFDPSSFLENKKTVAVYIDSNNPARYFMDISFLPQKAN